jgi:hypothetical protein
MQSTVDARVVAPLAHRIVRCTPDSPVNYSGERLTNSREWLGCLRLGLVHRTVSSVPKQHTLMFLAPKLFVPQLNFFLGLRWTLCTWDNWHLGKLVSPRGLWWTSTTKIDYWKWLSPFSFKFQCRPARFLHILHHNFLETFSNFYHGLYIWYHDMWTSFMIFWLCLCFI